jgi:hypothetical protein
MMMIIFDGEKNLARPPGGSARRFYCRRSLS